jgi:hypothetical protein
LTLTSEQKNSEKINKDSEFTEFEHVFKVWSKYEEIAMHFNELLIKLRVQALGTVAILGTFLGTFGKQIDPSLLKFFMPTICIFWVAIYILDCFYYNRLLAGAVKSILEIESKYPNILNLSTKVEDEVGHPYVGEWFYGVHKIGTQPSNVEVQDKVRHSYVKEWFYGIVFFCLLGVSLIFIFWYPQSSPHQEMSSQSSSNSQSSEIGPMISPVK